MSPNLRCRQWGFYRPSGLKGVAVNPRNVAYFFGPGLLFLGCVFWAGEGDEVFVRHPNVVGSCVGCTLCFEVGTN